MLLRDYSIYEQCLELVSRCESIGRAVETKERVRTVIFHCWECNLLSNACMFIQSHQQLWASWEWYAPQVQASLFSGIFPSEQEGLTTSYYVIEHSDPDDISKYIHQDEVKITDMSLIIWEPTLSTSFEWVFTMALVIRILKMLMPGLWKLMLTPGKDVSICHLFLYATGVSRIA